MKRSNWALTIGYYAGTVAIVAMLAGAAANPDFGARTGAVTGAGSGSLGDTLGPRPIRLDPGYDVRFWRTDDGLPSDSVRGIVQTRDGYLWIGTNAGLARFDGTRFTVFNRANTPALGSDECSLLSETAKGVLLVATMGGGLTRFENGRWESVANPENYRFQYAMLMVEDRLGRVLIGTDDLMCVYENGRLRSLPASVLPLPRPAPLFKDEAGRVWIQGKDGRIGLLDGERFSLLTDDEIRRFPTGKGVLRPFPAPDGARWFYRSDSRELWRRGRAESSELESFDLGPLLPGDHVARLLPSPDGTVWAGLLRGGVRHLAAGTVAAIGPDEGLPLGPVTSLVEDRERNLWVGTTGGLARLRRRSFAALGAKDGLRDERTWCVMEDSRGDVWIGTDTVLERLHDGRVIIYGIADGLPGLGITSLSEDSSGRIWIGTTFGLARFEHGAFRAYRKKEGLPDDNVRALMTDREGRLWIGTGAGGLAVFENDRFRTFAKKDGLGSNWVRFIHEDATGDLWICTTAGLSRLHGTTLRTFTRRDGLAGDLPLAVQEGADGALWIGTYQTGISRYKNGRFATLTTAHGLPDDTVLRILGDGAGSFWISSPRGIYRVAERDLDAAADGTLASIPVVSYGKQDGMPTTDCGGGTQPAGWKGRDGRLWFPTSKGVAVLDPRLLEPNPIAPPVAIDRVVHDQSLAEGPGPIVLTAGTRSLEIAYSASSFRAPEKVRFRYRLEGFDPGWIDAGPRRAVYYTNLPPGHYRFQVIAANEDGVWNDQGATVAIVQRPFVWQTAWFWTLVALAGLGVLFAAHRYRLRQAESRFAAVLSERNRIARELHDTIAQGFTGVSMQLEAVAAKLDPAHGEARENLDRARLLVRSSLADARRSVRDLRPLLLESGDLVSSLRAVAAQLTAGTTVRAEVHIQGRERKLSGIIEDHLLRVGQEAMTNAIRHGGCGTVRVMLAFSRADVSLAIEDDGRGFEGAPPPSQEGSGLGVPGMRERLAQVGGSLTVASVPGKGTRIVATAPAVGAGQGARP